MNLGKGVLNTTILATAQTKRLSLEVLGEEELLESGLSSQCLTSTFFSELPVNRICSEDQEHAEPRQETGPELGPCDQQMSSFHGPVGVAFLYLKNLAMISG